MRSHPGLPGDPQWWDKPLANPPHPPLRQSQAESKIRPSPQGKCLGRSTKPAPPPQAYGAAPPLWLAPGQVWWAGVLQPCRPGWGWGGGGSQGSPARVGWLRGSAVTKHKMIPGSTTCPQVKAAKAESKVNSFPEVRESSEVAPR